MSMTRLSLSVDDADRIVVIIGFDLEAFLSSRRSLFLAAHASRIALSGFLLETTGLNMACFLQKLHVTLDFILSVTAECGCFLLLPLNLG